MSRQCNTLSIAMLSLLGALSVNVAFADDAITVTSKPAAPLPQDAQSALSANPATPNCYPDINNCATYPTGSVTKDNPLQKPQGSAPQPDKNSK